MYKEVLYVRGIIDSLEKNQFNIPCMNHNETSGRSLSINFEKDIFKCFSSKCSNFKGSIAELCSHLGLTSSLITNQHIQTNKPQITSLEDFPLYDYNRYLKWDNKDYSYLLKRRISQEVIESNLITNVDFMKRLFMPFIYNKQIYGIVGRSLLTELDKENILNSYRNIYQKDDLYTLSQDNIPKDFKYINYCRINERYVNSKELPKNELFYEPLSNNYKTSSTIYITEGIINTLSINTLGHNSIAIIGSQPSVNHIKLIKQRFADKQIVTVFDNDLAGINCRYKFNKLYGESLPYIALPININDINDLIVRYKNIILERFIKYF